MSNITAEVKTVENVLKLELNIPEYQRPYRWHVKNVTILLDDIMKSWKDLKSAYRIGSLILHRDNEDGNNLKIVDGQQRITTLLLILHSLSEEIKPGKNDKKWKIGEDLRSKLKYNHQDSVTNIRENKQTISKWIKNKLSDETIKEFYIYLIQKCEFVEIIVDDLSEAFQMFDSQNTRGRELEPYNLLKAYHIRAMETEPQGVKIKADRKWEHSTLFKKEIDNEKKPPIDILKQIFSEQLYRTRQWSRNIAAYGFDKNKIDEFKGFSTGKYEEAFPYQNTLLLNHFSLKYLSSMGLMLNDEKKRSKNINNNDISNFTLINQQIINGKEFFEYIITYIEIYKELFIYLENSQVLTDFKKFYEDYCLDYDGSSRTGDEYLKEVYKSAIFLLFDKFGEDIVNQYFKTLYAIIYRNRLERMQVKYNYIAKDENIIKIFFLIERAKTPVDLLELESMARKEVELRKDVIKVKSFFENENIVIHG
jgi:hypothetical protein